MSQMPELKDIVAVGEEAAQLLLDMYETKIEVGIKGAEEVVTEADRASEALLYDRLLKLLPGSGFFGEETGYHPGENAWTWVVDPLDGTHNYSVGIPLWTCTIGLLNPNREPVAGVVVVPTEQKTYAAARAQGAFLNGKPIRVSNEEFDSNSIIGVQSRVRLKEMPEYFARICLNHCGRTLGSIAYHCAMVARGQMRACMDFKVKLYDICGPTVIVEEAGGMVCDYDGKEIFPLSMEYPAYLDLPMPFFACDRVHGKQLFDYLLPDGLPAE